MREQEPRAYTDPQPGDAIEDVGHVGNGMQVISRSEVNGAPFVRFRGYDATNQIPVSVWSAWCRIHKPRVVREAEGRDA